MRNIISGHFRINISLSCHVYIRIYRTGRDIFYTVAVTIGWCGETGCCVHTLVCLCNGELAGEITAGSLKPQHKA
jgi:hypothetical protein